MKFFLLVCYILFLSLANNSFAQSNTYYSKYFSTEDGLPSNTIKDIIQDKDGIIWIASDGGLVKYDGINFTTYNDSLPSSYVKDLYYNKDRGLYIITDLGIGKFSLNENRYVKVLEGITDVSSDYLFYPKTIYFDSKNRMWSSETFNLSKFQNDKFTKYKFSSEYYSTDIKRSYLFAEVNDEIIASSWQGYFFLYDEVSDLFSKINFELEGRFRINAFEKINNKYYLGTTDGLYEFILDSEKKVILKRLADLTDISTITPLNNNQLLVGTWGSGLFIFSLSGKTLTKIDEITEDYINSITVEDNNDIWVSTDNGAFVLKKQTFFSVNLDQIYSAGISKYLAQIKHLNSKIYFTAGFRLFSTTRKSNNSITISELPTTYQGGSNDYLVTNDGYWIANQNGYLEFFNHKGSLLFSKHLEDGSLGRLCVDRKGNLWVFGVITKKVFKVNSNFEIEEYDKAKTKGMYVEIIKEADNGNIYMGGNNDSYNYFVKYDKNKNEFVSLKYTGHSELLKYSHVFDFDYNEKINSFLLATANGIIEYKNGTYRNVFAGTELENITSRSIVWESDSTFWFGSDKGLYISDFDDYAVYSKEDGLPSATVSARGLTRDNEGKVWIATVAGLAFYNSENSPLEISTSPFISRPGYDDKFMISENHFFEGVNLNINYSNRIFNSNQTDYTSRIIELDTNWNEPKKINSILISNLSEGNYTFQVKAKTPGKIWSKISEYKFKVSPQWYFSNVMYLVYITFLICILIYGILKYQNYKFSVLTNRKEILEDRVRERTLELDKTNDLLKSQKKDLQDLLDTREKLFSIIAHDLRSPFQSILALTNLLDDSYEEFSETDFKETLKHLNKSSHNAYNLLENLLEWSMIQTGKLETFKTKVNICDEINYVFNLQTYNAGKKEINLVKNDCKDIFAFADRNMVNTVIRNLISNAIKFTPVGGEIKVVTFYLNKKVVIEIEDNGVGMNEQTVKKIFTEKLKTTSGTEGEKGTGFGLVLCKSLIDMNEGTVKVNSEVGKGTTFVIYLPAFNEKP